MIFFFSKNMPVNGAITFLFPNTALHHWSRGKQFSLKVAECLLLRRKVWKTAASSLQNKPKKELVTFVKCLEIFKQKVAPITQRYKWQQYLWINQGTTEIPVSEQAFFSILETQLPRSSAGEGRSEGKQNDKCIGRNGNCLWAFSYQLRVSAVWGMEVNTNILQMHQQTLCSHTGKCWFT